MLTMINVQRYSNIIDYIPYTVPFILWAIMVSFFPALCFRETKMIMLLLHAFTF